MKKDLKLHVKFLFIISILILAIGILYSFKYTSYAAESAEFEYLSDIPYVASQSKPGWGNITMDLTTEGNVLSLKINGSTVVFKKGIFAHATSTVVYDISSYDYDYFTTYYGVSALRDNNGSVKFFIYTSVDGKTWDLETEENPEIMTGASEAAFVKIPIKGKNYLKLYADANGANAQDHALYGDSKLIKEGYNDQVTKSVEEYDRLIKEKYTGGDIGEELELLVLQREFVNRVGAYQLKSLVEETPEYREDIDWLMNDQEILRTFLVGGKPKGSYLSALDILFRMKREYIDDWNSTEISEGGVPLKNVYRTMIMASALEHSGRVYFWTTGQVESDPETRYEIYRDLYTENLIQSRIFEKLKLEEMRWVINTVIDDEEIKWLNNYARTVKNGATGPYSYIRYTFGYNYGLDKYYNEENRAIWEEKYHLADWGVTYGKTKLWIVFEEGSVCGGLSKTGSCVWGSYVGLPNTCVSQPGHCAYIMYSKDANGNGVWNLGNDVSGWGPSGNTEQLNSRMMNDWYGVSGGWQAPYVLLAQAAQNEYSVYEKAQIEMMLANVYQDDLAKKEELVNKALETEKINYGALLELLNMYLKDETKTEEDYYNLAVRIVDALTYYPKPMYDLLAKIGPKLTEAKYISQFDSLRARALNTARTANATNTIQAKAVQQVANFLIGNVDSTVATFSFDGENAGAIVLSDKFGDNEVEWNYSLDGGETWTQTGDKIHHLTQEELAQITAENDVKVHIMGVDYSEENIYTIDITASSGLPATLYANDMENKLIAAINNMEWRLNDSDSWTLYAEKTPDLTGNKTVEVRVAATGTSLVGESTKYTFTQDNYADDELYVSIDHLSVVGFSTESVRPNRNEYEYATNAIDGNINTWWHTDHTTTNDERYIIIKLDEPKYISKLQYVPRQNYNFGVLKNGTISASVDGENFEEVAYFVDAEKSNTPKEVKFDTPVYTQYIKFKCTKCYDYLQSANADYFLCASMINLFEDSTRVIPTADIEYSRKDATAKPVTAKLVNKSTDITVTNNNGEDTYTFTENGEFIFEFVDSKGTKGSQKAKVDWILDSSFSLNGPDKNEIILSNRYGTNINWEYSLDGGETWTAKTGSSYRLSENEVNSLDANTDLKVRIVPNGTEEAEVITFDILPAENMPANLYANDLENKLIGATDGMEWRLNPDDEWTEYAKEAPILTGNRTLEVRMKAEGTRLASEVQEFTFTQDVKDDTKKYISIEHLSIEGFSSECVRPERGNYEYANNAIDGNINTWWHSSRTATNDERYIIIKLDEPKNLSMLQYVPLPNYLYGLIKDATVEVSLDGENWEEAGSITGAAYNYEPKNIEFTRTINAQYVKFKCTQAYDYLQQKNTDYFVCAAMINLFEDVSSFAEIDVEVEYDITELTNKDVTARLVCNDEELIITNGTDSYVFTENGEHTFEFEDVNGNKGSVTAKVDWIDKKAPVATVEYDITEKTGNDVTARLVCEDEEIIVTNNDGNFEYTFINNGKFTFEYKDLAGNTNSTIAEVNWIDKDIPEVRLVFDKNELTREPVTVTLECDETIIVTNNEGNFTHTFEENGEFTFEYKDAYGNKGVITAVVDWIKTEAPEARIEYSTTLLTNKDVVATLVCDEEIFILNEDKSYSHTFTENGTYEFKYKGKLGNEAIVVAEVNWIDKTPPTATIEYSTAEPTNQDVIARLVSDEKIYTLNEDDLTHTFTENGEFIFRFIDEAGNEATATAKVDWINKTAPAVRIIYSIEEPTNQDVIARLSCNEEDCDDDIIVTNNDGSALYTFTENGEFEFTYEDKLGNKGSITAKVDWIDKNPPVTMIHYDILEKTSQNVVATLLCEDDDITVLNNNGSFEYTFTENGEFEFVYQDSLGNEAKNKAKVTWIEKDEESEIPTFKFTANTASYVVEQGEEISVKAKIGNFQNVKNGLVALTGRLEFDKTKLEIKEVKGLNSWNFTEEDFNLDNFKFVTDSDEIIKDETEIFEIIFTVKDDAEIGNTEIKFFDIEAGTGEEENGIAYGNNTSKTIKIIERKSPYIESDVYNVNKGEFTITNIDEGTKVQDLKSNTERNRDIVVISKDGKEVTDADRIATGMIVKLVGTDINYILVVKGDTDGDGEITVNDIAQIKLHFIKKQILQGAYAKATDMDVDNKTTINDIALIKLMFIK